MKRWLASAPVVIDYIPAAECKNRDALYVCYKCGKYGFMVDDGGTHVHVEEEDHGNL